MKKANQFKAFLAAGVITAGMISTAVPAFAYDNYSDASSTLTITGVEEGSTVYAYPVVLDTYDSTGNHEWKYGTGVENLLTDGSIDPADTYYLYTNLNTGTTSDAHDAQGPAIAKSGTVYTLTGSGSSYSGQVPAGLYVITAQKDGGSYTYNATVVPVNYEYGSTGAAAPAAAVTAAVKKAMTPELKKETVENGSTSKHNSAEVGDTVSFKISVTIPDYDDAWNTSNLKFIINDALSAGLTLNQDSITYSGSGITQPASPTVITGEHSIAITLTGTDVFNNKGKTLEVNYTAVVNSNCAVNFDEDTNTASLLYSTRANSTDLSEPDTDKTKHYTFGIDTNVGGTSTETTNEITKKGIYKTSSGTQTVNLAGAEFQLLNSSGEVLHFSAAGKLDPTALDADTFDHVTSGSDGSIKMEGLDEGSYTLKESKAPEGYSLSTTEYPVTIAATYDDTTGDLKSYTVTIGSGTSAATFTHTKNLDDSITTSSADTFEINNTTMAELPATGGSGVIAVTIFGAAMMGVFGVVFLTLKKKKI